MRSKLENRRLKYMQLSCFFGLLLFQVRVHLRWQSFAGEKRRMQRCGERGVTGCAHQPERPELGCSCLGTTHGSWRTPLRTRQAFAWGHFSPFHLRRCILSSPVTAATVSLGPRSSKCWQCAELQGCPSVVGALSEAQGCREHRAVRSALSSPAVPHCDRFQNLSFRFSVHMAVFVTFSHIFKTSFAA